MAVRVFLLLIAGLTLGAQRYPIRVADGTPAVRGAVALAVDGRGALWVATTDQVLQFDGERSVAVPDPQGLLRGTLLLAVTSDGWVVSGSTTGLFVTHPARRILPRRLSTAPIHGLVARGERVFANFGRPTERLRGERLAVIDQGMERVRSVPTELNERLMFDNQGNLWFGCEADACRIDAADLGAWPPRIQRVPMHRKGWYMHSVVRDDSGCIWGRDNGVTTRRCPGTAKEEAFGGDVAPYSENVQIGLDREGNIWLPGPYLAVFPKGAARPYHVRGANGLPPNVNAWAQGMDGSYWLGSGVGLSVWSRPRRWEYWGEKEGIQDTAPIDTARLANGTRVMVGNGGMYRMDAKRERLTPLTPAASMLNISSVVPTGGDRFLTGMFAEEAREYDEQGRLVTPEPQPGVTDTVLQILPYQAGRSWWALGSAGLRVLDREGGKLRLRTPRGYTVSGNGQDGEMLADGTLYACTDTGLLVGREGEWKLIDVAQGLRENSGRAIAVRNAGEIFYGYNTREEYCRIRPRANGKPQIDHYSEAGGFGISRIHAMDIDRRRGWLWRGSRDGLKVAPLDAVDDPSQWVPFGHFEGFGEAVEVAQQGIHFDESDGSLWVGAGGELHHFYPDDAMFGKEAETRVFLASLQRGTGAVELAPERMGEAEEGSTVELRFGSLYFERRGALEYRFRVDGVERVSADGTVRLADLRAGEHTLEVSARVRPGREWRTAGEWKIRAAYPARRNPYYYGTASVALVLAGVGQWAWRRRAQARFQRQKQEFLDSLKGRRQSSDPAVLRMLSRAREVFRPVFAGEGETDVLAPGTVLGERYLLGRRCGSGGFSHVYVAEDVVSGETVAVKVYTETPQRDKDWLAARMEQEVEALERLRHPHIVRFLGHGRTAGGAPYLVMNFVGGEALRALLVRGETFSVARIRLFTEQMCGALETLHAAGIVHRDLKPENILMDGDSVTLIDFSIAIVKDPRATQHSLTRAAGSWLYMAPEQLVGYGAPGTDIYALALVIFELLTGRQAAVMGLGAETGQLARDLEEKLFALRPDLAGLGECPLREAVAMEVLARPRSAGEFGRAVAGWLGGDSVGKIGN